jgi:glucose-1-phosphate thymidylyltransferase
VDILLPAAGFGTRLRPQTWSKPKPLVSVAGKAMLGHVMDRLLPCNPSQVTIVTGFLGDQLETWARETLPIPSSFVEQPEMLGQCDAIIRARPLIPDDHDALILFPDAIFEADFSAVLDLGADAAMFTKTVPDPSALGIAVVDGDRITRLIEKPKEPISNLAVIGIYYVKRMGDLYEAIEEQIRRDIRLKGEFFIADAFQIMIDSGKKVVSLPVTEWRDCGNPTALLDTNRYLLDLAGGSDERRGSATIIAPSAVAADTTLENCVVGPYASIGAGVTIRDSWVRDSVIEDGATVTGALVSDSIIGRRARVTGTVSRLNVGDVSELTV